MKKWVEVDKYSVDYVDAQQQRLGAAYTAEIREYGEAQGVDVAEPATVSIQGDSILVTWTDPSPVALPEVEGMADGEG